MDKVLNKLLENVEKLPIPWQFVFLFTITFFISIRKILSNKKVQTFIMERLNNRVKSLSKGDLNLHDIFTKKNVLRNHINHIRFKEKEKTKVFHIILNSRMDTILKQVNLYLNKDEIYESHPKKLSSYILDILTSTVKLYDTVILDNLSKEYGESTAKDIFDFVMNRDGGFREYRADKINHLIYQVETYLPTSQIFDNNLERVEYFLSELYYVLRVIIIQTEKDFRDFNGHILKIIEKHNKFPK